jgi:hypothetical protein
LEGYIWSPRTVAGAAVTMCVHTTVPQEGAVPGLLLNTLRRGPKCSVLSLRSSQIQCYKISPEPLSYAATQDMRMVACISFSSSFREAHSTVEIMMILRKAGPREAIIWTRRVRRPPGPLAFHWFEVRNKREYFASTDHFPAV